MSENKPTIRTAGRYKLQYRGTECTNCGHPLDMSDKYCPNCSQANSTKKLTLKDFFDEFFSTLISYDSKLLNTLSAMLLRPGKITRDYINGKRVRYTNPFRFLLSLSIVYFLMINYSGNFSKWDKYGAKQESDMLDSFNNWNFSLNNENDNVDLAQLDSIKKSLDYKKFMEERRKQDSAIVSNPKKELSEIKEGSFMERITQKQNIFGTLIRKDSVYDLSDANEKYDIETSWENKVSFNAANGVLKWQRQPGSLFSDLISKLPFVIFFFLPVFALFIWLVYIRKKYNYTDHLTFSFHNTSLLFILLIISYLIDSIFDIYTGWFFLIVFLVYLFMSMKKFYQQGIFKTGMKYMFLNVIFFILSMFSMILFFIGNIFTF